MSSGSFKELSRAITTSVSHLALPLPEDLLEIINAYLEKHSPYDDSDAQRLQDELLNVYQANIADEPSRLAPFLAILQVLKPVLQGSGRLLQWWDKLSGPVLEHVEVERGLASQTRNTLLDLLIFDEDDGDPLKDAQATSTAVAENLLATWHLHTRLASEELDDHAQFVEGQIQSVLIAFGKRRPKDFLTTLDKFFVKKDTRISSLSLLGQFFRHQPPHLHQMLYTPLFENLLRCLQMDTSTRVISLAMTALIMFLPHIPDSTAKYLPALFNIYTRMLFWDRERHAVQAARDDDEGSDEKSEKRALYFDTKWDVLPYLLASEDESVPELLHYFTFLYGLYPINFMSYIRKPQRYLRHANFAGADDLDIQPMEIRQRSEPFRQVHLLHPNFFMLTIESELTDKNRFKRSEAADVVADCMALYVPGEDDQDYAVRMRGKKIENSDIPDHPLLDDNTDTPFQSRHNSWRDTKTTAVASPVLHGLYRRTSHASQSMPSTAESPSIHHSDGQESPTIPAQLLPSNSHHQLSDLINPTKSVRSSIYKSMTNESVASLALSNNHETSHVDAYISSLKRDVANHSPLAPSTNIDDTISSLKIAYLNREIQLLKNDLNFERYLKQQHLSHIGRLRRKQIREARVEAETQNLINANRSLKVKLEAAKQVNQQTKKEVEKSKTHSRKWEADLTAKLGLLREEKKKWTVEREELKSDLHAATENVTRMRQIIVNSESKELAAKQKVSFIEASHAELEKLRDDVRKQNQRIRMYEGSEHEALEAKASEARALASVKLLEMQLEARDAELEKAKEAFEEELSDMRTQTLHEQQGRAAKKESVTQDLIDSALATSRNRINELLKERTHLLARYRSLQEGFFALKEQVEGQELQYEESIITDRSSSIAWNNVAGRSDFESSSGMPMQPISSVGSVPHDEGFGPMDRQWTTPQWQQPRRGTVATSPSQGSGDKNSLEEGKKGGKIKPESEVRIYGRGGVQNIGKKEKGKDKEQYNADGTKKEKSNKLGIKAFGGRAFGGGS